MQIDKRKSGIKMERKKQFEEICTATWKEVYRFIYYKVQNREEAEDVTQETYAKAFAYFQKSQVNVERYSSYLKAMAMNIVRDRYRKNKHFTGKVALDDVRPDQIAEEDFSEAAVNRDTIEWALDTLSKEQQMVIRLRILEGYSVAETARQMNKKEGTIRVLQHRAIAALAKLIEDY
ncbi:MAG: polymerase, sigma-24 subunit, subfamily [Herbinix sp.]|nr:polymerase, sigma-24 subunit, subfamily [Herbinix sp.]